MTCRIAILLCVLCSTRTALASPTFDLFLTTRLDLETAGLDGIPLTASLTDGSEGGGLWRAAPAPSQRRSSGAVGLGVVGWLLSASFYSVCLTTGLPELTEGSPELVAVTLGTGGSNGALVIPDWAREIARSVGVVTIEVGREASSDESPTESGGGLELTLLPIGPANAAGLSISGCFR